MIRKFYWPAEWERHAATWLSWPHNPETWPNNLLAAQREFAAFVAAVAEVEPVKLLCGAEAMASAKKMVGDIANVDLVDAISTNDGWIRDYGPTFVKDVATSKPVAIDWDYNAWGDKYPPYDRDQKVASSIAKQLGVETVKPHKVLEGGAIEGNGAGIVMTTRSCLLNPSRNGSTDEATVNQLLQHYLGAKEILWLEGGDIEGDDTDGHVDQVARFVAADCILYGREQNSRDINFATFAGVESELMEWNAKRDRATRLIPLDLPEPVVMFDVRLPATYANFYFANGRVIVPQFQSPSDDRALGLLRDLLPKHEVIGLSSRELSVGLGSFHCLSQQQPA